jgi:hypothetical protein
MAGNEVFDNVIRTEGAYVSQHMKGEGARRMAGMRGQDKAKPA